MSQLAFKKIVSSSPEILVDKLSVLLKDIGFGVLTRIDFDQKINEKLGKHLNKTIILGVCHPQLAYEAYQQNSDVALLIPCNLVITQKGATECLVEFTKPSQMINFLKNVNIDHQLSKAESDIENLFAKL